MMADECVDGKKVPLVVVIYDCLVFVSLILSLLLAALRGIKHRRAVHGRVFPQQQQKHGMEEEKEWETEYKKIKFKRKIGRGNFGEVWEAVWLGSPVAVKMIRKGVSSSNLIEEIKIMSCLHHPNIVMFLGACLKAPNICLLLELCVHDHLLKFLQSEEEHNIDITMRLLLKLALDVARGLNYLHQKQGIIQRDIKSRNILVDENLNAKIADFGLSRRKKTGDENGMTACGTPAWTAPEVIRMEEYTEKVDVYSFAVVMWELLVRDEPYKGEGGVQIAYAAAEQGLRPQIPDFAPETYASLIRECWADNPDDRPDFSQILERLFEMMKEESNPDRAANFYFGQRNSGAAAMDDLERTRIYSLLLEDEEEGPGTEDKGGLLSTDRLVTKLYAMKSVKELEVWGGAK